jgi:hypothetical protein
MNSPATVRAVRGLVMSASSPVLGGVFEPVGGEYWAVQAHADDDRQLDSDHGDEADDAGTDEGQADQPDGAQGAGGAEDPVLAVAGHDTAGQPRSELATAFGLTIDMIGPSSEMRHCWTRSPTPPSWRP